MMSTRTEMLAQRFASDSPVLVLGFRPFYLAAGLFAVLAIPAWLLWVRTTSLASPALAGLNWHVHEMLFGFASAVIAGFLLTAVRNWTGRPTPTGAALAALVALWIAGRVLLLTGPPVLAAAVDVAFLPALGSVLAVPIWRSRNVRNLKILLILLALAGLNAAFHLAVLGYIAPGLSTVAYRTALDVIAILIAIMGGRVIPSFTANAIPMTRPRRVPVVEALAVGSLVVIAVADLIAPWWTASSTLWLVMLGIAAVAHAVRLVLWQPHRTLRAPLLLMLPLAYAWLPLALALRALAVTGIVSPVAATHALAVGAMSGLMLAMMMRSARGHTGRLLTASRQDIGAFVLLQLAAVARVLATLPAPGMHPHVMMLSAALFSAAFAIFVIAYWLALTRPRVDGKPG
jgi:uncharacterized protein involved in response to NO